MSTTLYRKYRPQTFAELVDQQAVKTTLQNELASGRLAHAYLFSGPRGVGKTSLARIFARSLNCTERGEKTVEPCNACASCQAMLAGSSLNLIEIDAASNRGIESIRELREQVKYPPVNGKHKIYIIDEAHQLTAPAFDALLKTLEEPPARVVFILCTTELHDLPETIVSRCQRFDFHRISAEHLVEYLATVARSEEVQVDPEVLHLIARHSEGFLRDALSLFGQLLSLGERELTPEVASLVLPRSNWKAVAELTELVADRQTGPALLATQRLLAEGVDAERLALDWLDYLRQLLLAKVLGAHEELSRRLDHAQQEELLRLAGRFSLAELQQAIGVLLQRLPDIRGSSLPQLSLELAVVQISERGGSTPGVLPTAANPRVPAVGPRPVAPLEGKSPLLRSASDGASPFAKATEDRTEGKSATLENGSGAGIAPLVDTAPALPLDQLRQQWPLVWQAVQARNYSLAAFLKTTRVLAVEGATVVIGCQYRFHQETLSKTEHRLAVEQTLVELFQQPLRVRAEVQALPEQAETGLDQGAGIGQTASVPLDAAVSAVLQEFGGSVVS